MGLSLGGLRPHYRDYRIISEPAQLRRSYVRWRFGVDLLSNIPFELLAMAVAGHGGVSPYWRLFRLPRLYRVQRLVGSLQQNVTNQVNSMSL